MNADQVSGRVEVLLGRGLSMLGTLLGSRALLRRGATELRIGYARRGYGDAVAAIQHRARALLERVSTRRSVH